MKIKISRISKNPSFLLLCPFFIIMIVGFLFSDFLNGGFYFNMFMVFAICVKAQFSIVTIWVLVSNYMLLNVYYFYMTGSAYGNLGFVTNLNFEKMSISLICFNVVLLFMVYGTHFLDYEKEALADDFHISRGCANIMGIMSVIMAYIALPYIGIGFGGVRFDSLLPGHFWNHFSIIFLIAAVSHFRDSRLVRLSTIVTISWFLIHAERVDVVGFLAFAFIKYCSQKGYKISLKFILSFFILFVGLFSLLIYIGNVRNGNTFTVSLNGLVTAFFRQGTASDIGHVFNGTFEYINDKGYLLGATFVTYIQGIIPFLEQPMRAGQIIQKYYHTAGGEFILTEPVLNFGYWGIVFLISLYVYIVYLIVKRHTNYSRFVYYFLTTTAFRYIWYGLTYIETGLLYLIPCMFGIISLLRRRNR